jgi:hypothetical protein
MLLFGDGPTVIDSHSDSKTFKEIISVSNFDIKLWFKLNKLCSNTEKPKYKRARIYVNDKLTWETHISYIPIKISQKCYLLRHLY